MVFNKILKESKCDVIVITDPYNLRYYTGFCGGEGTAVFSKHDKVLLVDSRYTEEAINETKNKGNGFKVYEFGHAKSKYALIIDYLISLDGEIKIGFEDESMLVSDKNSLTKALDGNEKLNGRIKWEPLGSLLNKRRQIKSKEEINLLRKAEAIGDMAFADVLKILKPGITELDVACEIEYSMKKHGAQKFSFDTIAASGINSSMPHAILSEKKLEVGDFLTMDFGCVYKGYCSDMTRTVVIGKANDEQKKIYEIVRQAQEEALAFVKPGVKCMDVDKVARDIISSYGYGDYFGHGLGHSVGLFIHESPALNSRDATILCEGMIETIEPGIYIPGFGGVRIEDMGVITKDGFDNFTSSPKDLIEIY